MAISNWKSLPFKTGLSLTIASGLLTAALSYGTYTLGVKNVISDSRHMIEQSVETIETTAAIAAFVKDALLAQEIISGLANNDMIAGVMLVSTGEETEASSPSDANEISVQAGDAFERGEQGTETFNLASPFFEGEAGLLFVKPDYTFIDSLARKQAKESVLSLALISLLLTGLAILLVHGLLAKPLAKLAAKLHDIDPGSDARLVCPPANEHDEIGQLITDTNLLLDSAQKTLEGERRLREYVEALQQKTREEAERDPLTRLYNRRAGERALDRCISDCLSSSVESAVILVDLDNFKPVNDTHGHEAGDLALITVAQRLVSALRQTDIVIRWGGDEFLLIVNQDHDMLDSVSIAKKVLERIGRPIEVKDDVEVAITASVGIALCPLHASERHALLDLADAAMYQSKRAGGNTYFIHGSDTEQELDDHYNI